MYVLDFHPLLAFWWALCRSSVRNCVLWGVAVCRSPPAGAVPYGEEDVEAQHQADHQADDIVMQDPKIAQLGAVRRAQHNIRHWMPVLPGL